MNISGVSAVGSAYGSYSAPPVNHVNPSDMAIEEKTKAQIGGYSAGSENITSARAVTNVTDGGLEGITDYLQSIRELALKASNGLNSQDELDAIQNQISQYIQGIDELAGATTYNEKNLLSDDSSMAVATNGNGAEMAVNTYNSTTQALGIDNFKVNAGSFNLDDIDKALEKVTASRANNGAISNAFDYAKAANSYTSINLTSSMDDPLDKMVEEYQKRKTQQNLDAYRAMLQKKEDEQKHNGIMNIIT